MASNDDQFRLIGADQAYRLAHEFLDQGLTFCTVWTASRVAKVIDQTFGIRYHRDHVGRLLREAGWSRQQPIERATQRNEAAIKQWSEQRWPALKKKPSRSNEPSSS